MLNPYPRRVVLCLGTITIIGCYNVFNKFHLFPRKDVPLVKVNYQYEKRKKELDKKRKKEQKLKLKQNKKNNQSGSDSNEVETETTAETSAEETTVVVEEKQA
jgi:hypothetical protein